MGLDSIELILATEAEFGIEIADADAANLLTPRQLAAHVSQLLGQQAENAPPCPTQAAYYRARRALRHRSGAKHDSTPTAWNQEDVLQRVMQITATQLGLSLNEFNPDSRFVEDLGID